MNIWLQLEDINFILDTKVGQRIIEVNGQSLLGASHNEAVSALREVGDNIELLVCDGWNTPTPRSPEPVPVLVAHLTDAVLPPDSTTQNGQVSSVVELPTKSDDSSDRPSSVNGEKVRQNIFISVLKGCWKFIFYL